MRFGAIGRTKALFESIRLLESFNHELVFIVSAKEEEFYDFDKKNFINYSIKKNIPFFDNKLFLDSKKIIEDLNADICISVNYPHLIPCDFLNIFKYGVLNAHGGELPKYKGNACINWSILNFEKFAGITIHQMTKKLDEGPIYLKKKIKLNNDFYVQEFYDWFYKVIPQMFLETLKKIEKGKKPSKQENRSDNIRCYPRKPNDSIIDWRIEAKNIHALIRASSRPFSGAICFTEKNQKVTIFRASLLKPSEKFFAVPGQICFFEEGPVIACGSTMHMLKLEEFYIEELTTEESKDQLKKSLRGRLI